MFTASTAAVLSHSPSHFAQIEGANFLNLLIVDDDRAIREACRDVAQSLGFNTQVAESAEQAYRLLDSSSTDAVLLDMRPGAGALEALHTIKKHRADALVIVVTGYGTVKSAVQAMKDGAYGYVTKPFSMDELRLLLERVSAHLRLKTENRAQRETIKSRQGLGNMVGRAPDMEKLYRIIAKAGQSVHPVLILGESGTGKELVAKSIHFSGIFRSKPFIPVDCGSLVPTLIESDCSGTCAEHLPGRRIRKTDCWPSPKAARCFSTRLASCQWTCRRSCCGPFRRRRFVRSEASSGCPSMCGFWPPPIATWNGRWPRVRSGAISFSGSTC